MSVKFIFLIIILSILIVSFVYTLLSSAFTTTNIAISRDIKVEPIVRKSLDMFGGDVYSLIPKSVKNKYRHNSNLQQLFIASDNPWNVNPIEFLLLRAVLALTTAFTSIIAILVLQSVITWMITLPVAVVLTALAYYYPMSVYKSAADDRLTAFRNDLPNAIDYLIIALSGGRIPLTTAIHKIIPYLPENSIMYTEFKRIDEDVHSGRTMTEALNAFATRAPSPEITAFVNSLNSANRLNTPIVSMLRERAKAARQDKDNELDKKIQSLPTKVMLVFGPTSYISILIIALAPAASSLMGSL